MASVNGKAATMVNSTGMLAANQAGTGNSAGGFETMQPDALEFAYTATSASPAVFTANANAKPYIANGMPVSLGYTIGPFAYTCTQASPAVVTVYGLSDLENIGSTIPALGVGVIFVGSQQSLVGFTSSVFPFQPYNSPASSITQYYMVATVSGQTFSLSATQAGSAINTTGTAITKASEQSVLYFYGGVPGGFSAYKTYYMVSANSGAGTFQLAATSGGAAVNSSSIGAGMFALQTQMGAPSNGTSLAYVSGAPQVNFGAGTQYQSFYQGGFRVGLQPGQAVASASSLSLDEDPQLAWQNVPGSTCQFGNAQALGGTTGTGGAPAVIATPVGWGQLGGISTSGAAGQYVDEVKFHVDDNGNKETSEHRKARLTQERDALKAKGSRSAAEAKRLDVVENALNELK